MRKSISILVIFFSNIDVIRTIKLFYHLWHIKSTLVFSEYKNSFYCFPIRISIWKYFLPLGLDTDVDELSYRTENLLCFVRAHSARLFTPIHDVSLWMIIIVWEYWNSIFALPPQITALSDSRRALCFTWTRTKAFNNTQSLHILFELCLPP